MDSSLEGYVKELKSVKQELRDVEQQLQTLLAHQASLTNRRKELEAILQQHAAQKQQQADTEWDRQDFSWSEELEKKLQSVFKMDSLRPMQLQTMNATLAGRDCLLIMPTGGGKSLCFHLPALLSKGITLVVSPLVSLMEDQVMALEQYGVEAVMLNADADKAKVKYAQEAMTNPRSTLCLIYVTPEKLSKSKRFMNLLEKAYKAGRFSRLVIDEVHCCSQWGHDFRPDYKFLGIMKRQFPNVPLLGLTATATLKVLDDVKNILCIPSCLLLRSSFNRPNLYYQVRQKPSSQAETMDDMHQLISKQFSGKSGIVYCFSQKDSEEVTMELQKRGIRAGCYHANLSAQERSRVHKLWTADQIQVVVATVAFGMGIDKPDVRFVIHHSLSKSMENLYQESGRAGRDGQMSHCILYYRFTDVGRQSTMVFTERTGLENLYGIVAYCIDVSGCRRARIARHFGELWDAEQCVGMCDHCDPKRQRAVCKRDVTRLCQDVMCVLENAAATNQRVTAAKLLDAWYGKGSVTLRVREVKAPGVTREKAERILAHILLEGYLKEDFHFTAYSTICYLVPGPKAKLLASETAHISMEFESKPSSTPSASHTPTPSGASPRERKETKASASETGAGLKKNSCRAKPVIINREHSHFTSLSATTQNSEDETTCPSSGSSQRKASFLTGEKRKPVVSSDDSSNEDGSTAKENGEAADLRELVFDDSDVEEPKRKTCKTTRAEGIGGKSVRRRSLSLKRKKKSLHDADVIVQDGHRDAVLLDTGTESPICVGDSD